jgi:hypothetical protein
MVAELVYMYMYTNNVLFKGFHYILMQANFSFGKVFNARFLHTKLNACYNIFKGKFNTLNNLTCFQQVPNYLPSVTTL